MAYTPGIKADKVCQIVRYLSNRDIRVTTALDVDVYQFVDYQTMIMVTISINRINTRSLLESACYILDKFYT